MNENVLQFLSPQSAWDKLQICCVETYEPNNAMYTGDHALLNRTSRPSAFWARNNKARIHVPIAADIAATSANMLFGKEPKFTLFHDDTEVNEEPQQKRFQKILDENNLNAKLNEAAEIAAALGDVYIKLRWNDAESDTPIIDVVQPDQAYPEYRMGHLACVHFFTAYHVNTEEQKVLWLYERYEPGKVITKAYDGTYDTLGTERIDDFLANIGLVDEVTTPVSEMLAIHIPNMLPNRGQRFSMLGRSDLAGLRDLCDALDETYTSWIRDIRLAKARLIVPADYLRRKPAEVTNGLAQNISWEFDTDMEAYVAMDIASPDGDKPMPITSSQFSIRSTEHADTCSVLIQNILQLAGYSPQTFGLNISGSAQSGTALEIRERKTAATRDKKQTYWQSNLEKLMTALVHLDAAIYPNAGSHADDVVRMRFSDSMGESVATLADTVQRMYNAQSSSVETRVRMLHSDWDEPQIMDEIERVRRENGIEDESPLPDIQMGDNERTAQNADTEA